MSVQPLEHIKLSFKCPKQLNELQPCNGDWYCDGCRKAVYDFRGMTEAQVLASLVKNNYKICGIFEAGRIEVMPQQNKWFRWLPAAMLALGLTGLHKNVYAQTKKVIDTTSVKDTTRLTGTISAKSVDADKAVICPLPETGVFIGVIETDPEFPGGEAGLRRFLNQNLKNPKRLAGKAYAQFMVGKDGRITNVNIIRTNVPEMNDEVIRVLKAMPKWKPGIENGKPIAVQYTVPVKFESK